MIKKDIIPIIADRLVPSVRNAFYKVSGQNKAFCLCFHDVSERDNSFATLPELFFSLISLVKKNIVSIENLKETTIGNPILLTFDDGFESMISTVSPFLASESIPFACYVTTDYINQEGYMSEKQLRELSQNPLCTIGSHMCTHSKTRQMSSEQVRDEWVKSKEILESITGKGVRHAALPYGSYLSCTEKSKRIALASGYSTIANTIATPFSKNNKEIYRYVYQKNVNRVEQLLNGFSK